MKRACPATEGLPKFRRRRHHPSALCALHSAPRSNEAQSAAGPRPQTFDPAANDAVSVSQSHKPNRLSPCAD